MGVSVCMCMYECMYVYLCHMCAGVWGSKKRMLDSLASCRMPIMRSEPESLRRAPRALSKWADSPVPQIILVKKKINWRVDPECPEVSFNLQSKNLRNFSLNKKPTASTIFFFLNDIIGEETSSGWAPSHVASYWACSSRFFDNCKAPNRTLGHSMSHSAYGCHRHSDCLDLIPRRE